ncbi:MAG: eIF2A-related protein [Rhodomicrobium sp.]
MISAGRAAAYAFGMAALLALALLKPVNAEGAGDVAAAAPAGGASAQANVPVEVVPQVAHSGVVNSVAFSPDGKRVLSGGQDQTLKLWDAATGMLIRTFRDNYVTSVAFSPDRDGKWVLSGSTDQTLKLWDAPTGKLIRKFSGHTGEVTSVAFSPDGRLVLSGSDDRTLRLWDAFTGELVRSFKGHTAGVKAVAFSPDADGRRVLSGSFDGTLKIWDAETAQLIRSVETDVTSVAFAPGGRRVLSGSWDQTLKLWDAATGNLIRAFKGHTQFVTSVAFSPDGTRVLSGSEDGTLKLWNTETGQPIRNFERPHGSGIKSVAFSPEGRRLLSGGNDEVLRVWDADHGDLLRSFQGPMDVITSVAFSRDGARALSGSRDGTLKLWSAATGQLIPTSKMQHSGWVNSVAFSPDGKQTLSGSFGELRLWNAETGQLLRKIEDWGSVDSVAFSPDGTHLLSGGGNRLKLWDADTGKLLRAIESDEKNISAVAFSPNGTLVLCGGMHNTLELWDMDTRRLIQNFKGHSNWVHSVAFSPRGTRVLSGSWDRTVRLWDVSTGNLIRSFEEPGWVESVAFSPDGEQVLSGGWDNKLNLWDVKTGQPLRTFTGHTERVLSAIFSPVRNDKRILSGSWDKTLRFWDRETGKELALMLASPNGEWLTITPAGFFSSSSGAAGMVSAVRGLDVTTIGQVYQSLYNPDLVRMTLSGDADDRDAVKKAAKAINLEAVLDSGPAPEVTILSPEHGAKSAADLVTVAARIKDRGKGIGRIEWRVNGVTAAVLPGPSGSGPDYTLSRELALDAGSNTIEVIAYNGCVEQGCNLLASLPARITVEYTAPAESAKGKLYVLAVGINRYVDRGWEHSRFPPLRQAVRDAKAFAAEMQKAGAGMYSEVRVWLAPNADATAAGLHAIFKTLAAKIEPRDTFVLFAAAHGASDEGHFYLIPQDYQGGYNPGFFKDRAISQERLQEWMADIKARHALILLDTCRSGELVSGYTRPRTGPGASEAAVGRLHEATGRPVLTASNNSARETGKLGHGIFTYALIEALHHAGTDSKGYIQVSGLASYVEDLVPKLAAEAEGGGRAAIVIRGSGTGPQAAHFGSTGGDFALVRRLAPAPRQ